MNKAFITVSIFLTLTCLLIGVALYVQEAAFSPVDRSSMSRIMKINGPDFKLKKIYSADLIGISIRGELYDFYVFQVSNLEPESNYPDFSDVWEGKQVGNEVLVGKWKKDFRSDSAYTLFKTTLKMDEFISGTTVDVFMKELDNPSNYFSFVYFNDIEHYFFYYSINKNLFYYIRKRGL